MNAREVIATSAGVHETAKQWGSLSTHNHAECLTEADLVIESLRRSGYEVTAVASLPEVERAAIVIHGDAGRCDHPLCLCHPRA